MAISYQRKLGDGTIVIDSGTSNVGIGTNDPLRKLHVVGDFAVNANTGEYYGVLIQGGESATPKITIGDWHNSSATIKWDSSANHLVIDSQHSTSTSSIVFTGNDSATEYMRITASGQVGIGTTAPNEELEVRAAGFSTVAVNTDRNTTGDSIGSFSFYGHNSATTPENLLYSRVIGSISDATDGSENSDIFFQQINDGTIIETFRVKSSGTIQFPTYGAGYLRTDADGNVIVDTSTVEDTLDTVTTRGNSTTNSIVVGGVGSSGEIALYSTGTANATNTEYHSHPLRFSTSGWDTNNSVARNVHWNIRSEASSNIYPDAYLTFYEENISYDHWKLKLPGRGSGSSYIHPDAALFNGNIGIYESDTSNLKISLKPTGDSYFTNNLGIGTTSPIGTLEVQAASSIDGTQLTIANDYGESSKVLAFNNDTDQVGYLSVYGRPSTSGDGPYMSLGLSNGTSVVERMHIAKNGSLDFNAYGAGGFKGDATYVLGVDSSGNVVETTTAGVYFGTNTSNGTYTNQWQRVLVIDTGNFDSQGFRLRIEGTGNTSGQSIVAEIEFNYKNQNGAIRARTTVNSYGTSPVDKDDVAVYFDTTNLEATFYFKVKENYTAPIYSIVSGRIRNYAFYSNVIGDDTALASETNDSITSNLKFQGITQDNDSGYVGINQSAPGANLVVGGSSTFTVNTENSAYVRFGNLSSSSDIATVESLGDVVIAMDSNNNSTGKKFAVRNNGIAGDELMTVLDTGNVGIGTTSPQHQLNIAGATPTILLQGTGQTLGAGDVLGSLLFYNNDSSTAGGARVTGSLKQVAEDAYGRTSLVFGTSTTDAKAAFGDPGTYTDSTVERMRIDSSGDIGIGTDNPRAFSGTAFSSPILDLSGSFNIRGLSADGNSVLNMGGDTYRKAAIYTSIGTNSPYLAFATSASGSASSTVEAIRIDASQNVGIGTTSPDHKLHVEGASNDWATKFRSNNSTSVFFAHGSGYGGYINAGTSASASTYLLELISNGSTRMYVRGDGNVGIGTTNPGAVFTVGEQSTGTSGSGVAQDNSIVSRFGAANAAGRVTGLTIANTATATVGNDATLSFIVAGNYSATGLISTVLNSTSTAGTDMVFSLYNNSMAEKMRIKSDGTIQFNSYGAGFLQTDANGNITAGSVTTSDTLDDVTDNGNSTTNSIILGDSTTNGTMLVRGSYASGNIVVIGGMKSSGGAMIGYAVKPDTANNHGFVSSSAYTLERAAYYQQGNRHRWYGGASQNAAIGNAVTMSEMMTLNYEKLGLSNTSPATLLHLGNSTSGANIISFGDATLGGPHGLDFYGNDATRTIKYSIYYRTGTENISMETNDGTKRFEINQSGAVTLNEAFTFPTTDGSAGAALVTNGSGSLSWGGGYQQYTPVGWGILNNQTYTSTGANISSSSTQLQSGTTPVQRNSATEFEATKAGWYEISYSFIVKNNYANRAMVGAYMSVSTSGGGGIINGSHSTQYVRYTTYGEYAQIQNTFYCYTSYSSTLFYLYAYLLSGSMNMTTQAIAQSMISFRYINNDIT